MTGMRIPRAARLHTPVGASIVRSERMSPSFAKYHLDDGRILHRFTREEPNAAPHDHPWSFETVILAGGYVEEVFRIEPDGGWSSALVRRLPGTRHRIAADHIHRIVQLPSGECWTLVTAGRSEREVRFWRFGGDIRSRAWHQRHYVRYRLKA